MKEINQYEIPELHHLTLTLVEMRQSESIQQYKVSAL